MEVLINYSRILIIFLLFGQSVLSQDYNKLVSAFQESYLHEASGDLQKATDVF